MEAKVQLPIKDEPAYVYHQRMPLENTQSNMSTGILRIFNGEAEFDCFFSEIITFYSMRNLFNVHLAARVNTYFFLQQK